MNANDRSLTYFFNENTQFVIPFFQRRYVWEEENWQQLWDELISADSDCYLGTFILKRQSNITTNDYGQLDHCMLVIDGQQRLTTISLLMRAIIDELIKHGENVSNFERLIYYIKEYRTGFKVKTEKWCKLIQSRFDNEVYKSIILGTWKPDGSKDDSESGRSSLARCYAFFKEKVKSTTDDEIEALLRNVHSDDVKPVVIIELGENEDEQKIFDTVNSTGVPLTVSEIIKNALFGALACLPSQAEGIYNSTWKPEFELDESRVRDWTSTKGTGQNARAYIDSFFHCYAVINGFFDIEKDKMSNLARCYKRYLTEEKARDSEGIEGIIRNIVSYAKTYREFFIRSSEKYSYSDWKCRLYHILAAAKISTFDPYILKLLKRYDIDQNEDSLRHCFKMLENYVMRHFAIHTAHIKSFNMDCKSMISNKFDFSEAFSDSSINDDSVKGALSGYVSNARAKLILFWIELHRSFINTCSDQNVASYDYKPLELEHIMPQEWDKWDPIVDENNNDVTKRYVFQIGNMTLLTSRLNKQVSNRPFNEKVNGCIIDGKEEVGIKKLSTFSITNEVSCKDSWTGNDIANRTQSLAKEFCDLWPTVCGVD